MLRSLEQNKQMHALLSKLCDNLVRKQDLEERKQDLVWEHTHERTWHSSEMTISECQSMIEHLKLLLGGHNVNLPAPIMKGQRMRRKILSICHEMNWRKGGKIDWTRLNSFLIKSGYLHKELNAYTPEELPALVTQFESILKKYYDAKG